MAKLNISQAAKTTGKSRRTIQRHLSSGKLSYDLNDLGQKCIDPSELLRVYGELKNTDALSVTGQSDKKSQQDAPQGTPIVTSFWQEKVKMLENEVEDLKEQRGVGRGREEKLQALIEDQQKTIRQQLLLLAPPEPKPEEQPTASPQPVPNLAPIKKQNWLSKMWNGDREKQRQRVANQTAKTGQDAPIQPASTS